MNPQQLRREAIAYATCFFYYRKPRRIRSVLLATAIGFALASLIFFNLGA